MKTTQKKLHGIDQESVLIEARKTLAMPSRRLFAKRALTLGGLAMLTGCSLSNDKSVESFLSEVSRLNDQAQAWLFDPTKLAPTYPKRRSRDLSRSTRTTTSTKCPTWTLRPTA